MSLTSEKDSLTLDQKQYSLLTIINYQICAYRSVIIRYTKVVSLNMFEQLRIHTHKHKHVYCFTSFDEVQLWFTIHSRHLYDFEWSWPQVYNWMEKRWGWYLLILLFVLCLFMYMKGFFNEKGMLRIDIQQILTLDDLQMALDSLAGSFKAGLKCAFGIFWRFKVKMQYNWSIFAIWDRLRKIKSPQSSNIYHHP